MIDLAHRLEAAGVVGINRRNAEMISRLNPRRLYPLVDDKLRTKELALKAGMSVPELYGVISTQHDARDLPGLVSGRESFVVKPAHGSGGNGILVIRDRQGGRYKLSDGEFLEERDLRHHVSSIVSGLYSLGGQRDRAMLEYRVRLDPTFATVSYQGVPDIRIIVYVGYPVMAMVRLPTRRSHGKANLHQGAVGAGIDLGTGRTVGGVQDHDLIDEHPDTGSKIAGLEVQGWNRLLELAARCHELTGLGYLGVDIVLDLDFGPMILELNARPGLDIQIANRSGLMRRLEAVDRRSQRPASISQRLEFSRSELCC